jgi:nucleoside-diphosphate-sugar epimerase
VAGATSAVGPPAVRALVGRGHQVTALVRAVRHRRPAEDLGATAVLADALDAEAANAALADARPEVVVDLLTAVPRGGAWHAEDMEATNRLRVEGTATSSTRPSGWARGDTWWNRPTSCTGPETSATRR